MGDLLTGLGLSENVILAITIYAGLIVVAFWLALVLWTYRDMRARSRDAVAQLGLALMVAVLTVPGLLIYLLLRPRETLGESYERSLEEEALLQEIENKPKCPGCSQRVQDNWQACPHCHTRLKKPCIRCGNMLELSWQLCPYCATAQGNYAPEAAAPARQVRPASVPETWTPPTRGKTAPTDAAGYPAQSVEFIEGDDYS
ncbi:MAG TPA: zinc ribbon domain-containing protein [Phototrophicaceae bacterium]|nr:zinc ribbon domain-containing protein [Phototrophicaceae bacterium]